MTRTLALALLTSSALLPCAALAQTAIPALPTDGRVVRGEAVIHSNSPQGMTIHQGSDRAIIDWSNFSVGEGARIDILQNDHRSALLNRVTGNTNSTIAGQINANGQVFLVNPNGILITPTGSVKAAGFVASTLGLSNDAFMAGDITVTGRGGAVTNAGTISVVKGGYAALIGGRVENKGNILAPLGRVAIGSAAHATLDLEGDGFLQVAMPAAGGDAGVFMPGRIVANGGAVVLAAGQAREAARGVVNLTGNIEACGLEGRSGAVTLTGGAITLAGATIDASGAGGGGSIRIGGDWQGQGPLDRAQTLAVDAASAIRADALGSGDGGRVVLWSDAATDFAGTISAQGAGNGRGGDAEVSGKARLSYTGSADLRGPGGFGNLLLDPYDITISNGADTSGFNADRNDSVINVGTLQNALALANVTVQTGAGGTQAGNIAVAAPLAWNSGATLTLQAAGGIAINAPVTAQAGGLTLNAGSTITATGAISIARFTLASGDWRQIATSLPAFATADFRLNGGSFVRALGGSGVSNDAYRLTDVYGLQGIDALLNGHFALANDIDATSTKLWNGGLGFKPVANIGDGFDGSFDGRGYTISGMVVNRPNQDYVGLFARQFRGRIQNLSIVGSTFIGRDEVGAVAGFAQAGGVSQVYIDADVRGRNDVGGIIGYMANGAYITDAYSNSTVAGSTNVGGITGQAVAYGVVERVYVSGRITGATNVGGIFGRYTRGQFNNVFWDIETTGQANGGGDGTVFGTGLTTAQARNAASYTGFDFNTIWYQAGDLRPILRSEAVLGKYILDGVEVDAYLVSNLHQLQLMGADLGANYVLTRDIDASATNGANSAGVFGAGGFVPVGTGMGYSGTAFSGRLIGDRHVIRNLVIYRPGQDYVGLIGGLGGSVRTIGLEGGSITGRNYVGALVGDSANSIHDSYATANVTGQMFVGGLVGQAASNIRRSYATGTVYGQSYVGGLVGTNGAYIEDSYASGAVTGGTGSAVIGGLVGSNSQSITRSYALGSVTGEQIVGGLVGSSLGNLSQSYATGRVTATSGDFAGGLFGSYAGGSITSLFWDRDTTGQLSASGAGFVTGATGLSTGAARSQFSYTGFDFDTIWYQAGDMRPILRSEAVLGADNVYRISNLNQLQLMGADLGGNYVLTRDIDASATASTAAASGIFGAGGFVPVGTSSMIGFAGSLDGAGHVVSDLTINTPAYNYVGLFGSLLDGASVRNLGLVDIMIDGLGTTGGLAGFSSGSVRNVYATGAIRANGNMVGGLIGYNGPGGTVDTAYTTVNIAGAGVNVGGLVGYNGSGGSVSNAYATGAVTGLNNIGGLIGANLAQASNVYATGAVSGGSSGGLVGYNSGTVSNGFWDRQTSGQATSSGGTGLTTAQMQDATGAAGSFYALAKAGGWDFQTVWAPGAAGRYAQLFALSDVVTVTSTDTTRIYGDTGTGVATSYYGLRPGQFVTTLATANATATASSNVGSYAINLTGGTVTALDGATATLVQLAGRETVTQRALQVEALSGQSRTYGYGNPLLLYTVGGMGLVNGDSLGGTLATTATIGANVGTYAITQGSLSASSNYSLTFTPGATLAITPRALTITPDAGQSRKYRSAGGALTYMVGGDGLYGGQTVSGGLGTLAVDASDVGNYDFTLGDLSAGGNYTLTLAPGGTFAVTPRALIITPDAGQGRTYGYANGVLGYTLGGDGLYGADTLGGALDTAAVIGSDVGTYAFTLGDLSAGGNYSLTLTPGTSFAITPRALTITPGAGQGRVYGDADDILAYTAGGDGLYGADALTGRLGTVAVRGSGIGLYAYTLGDLTAGSNYTLSLMAGGGYAITPRALTVNADTLARIYGDANPLLTYDVRGLVNGDGLSGDLATVADAFSNVGGYAITQGSLSAGANYTLNFNGATLAITPRALTVNANALSRIYGEANPVLSYAASGLVNGDGLTGALATRADDRSHVGLYAVTQGSLTAGANYALTFNGATLAVTPRALTINADSLIRSFGEANPFLSWSVGGMGLINGDTLSGRLATDADTGSAAGVYAISQGSLTASTDYMLSFVPGTLTVQPIPVALTQSASALMRDYWEPQRDDQAPAGDLGAVLLSLTRGDVRLP